MKDIEKLLTPENVTIKTAWKKLNDNGYKILFVVNEQQELVASITDGDIRRWVLDEGSLDKKVDNVMCSDPVVASTEDDLETIREQLLKYRIECVPVVDDQRKIQDVVCWEDLFHDSESLPAEKLDLPVVIMAGGRGVRLDPFTKVLPKPLMPIGDKTFLELVFDKFSQYGIREFILSLNYKSNMIKAYFQDHEQDYDIHYVHEESPLGTAGSLSLMRERLKTTFIVSNGDILIDANYSDIINFHHENANKITLVCSMQHVPIPYGVVQIESGGALKSIQEKPEFDHLVLTGLYIVEPEILGMIPEQKEFHMTHLIEKMNQEGQKIGVYPVAQKSWMDIGELEVYQKTLRKFQEKR